MWCRRGCAVYNIFVQSCDARRRNNAGHVFVVRHAVGRPLHLPVSSTDEVQLIITELDQSQLLSRQYSLPALMISLLISGALQQRRFGEHQSS